ncbi:WD40 repeat-like protein [Athelia psychrophila]|uniref:WD40 repeat-like protein n=1 Tax=Athelia psychrophila TaxID=1759441 RepID=A0A166AWQ9_9AGAM|nr:WD40 repeat-like protein [Fibularhizoctonia sp. CBS 109695]
MSDRPEVSSYVSTDLERIDGDSLPDQQTHGPSEGLATEDIRIAPIPTATFNTLYNAGTVTNVNGNINIYYENSGPPPPDLRDFHLDHAVRAQFDCGDRVACTEGTRADVIKEIGTWTENGPPVFWLNGSAGTGKSTIAFTLARSFNETGILGASFFCSRDDATCSNHKLIIPSIAHQLAHFHPGFRRRLAAVVKARPDIVHSDVVYQLQELIVQPLGSIRDFPSSCVIVIDALDECKDESTISVILTALSRHVEKLSSVKIFLTSRPERNINLGFRDSVLQGATRRLILHEIELSTVQADIKTYIMIQLEIVRRDYGIDVSWPFGVEVDSLSTLSCGLFIFVATAIKFIQDRNYDDPQGQLGRIVGNAMLLKDDLSDPRHRLDQLYLQVLKNAHPNPSPDLAKRLRLLLGTIVLLQDPLSFHGIQQLFKQQLGGRFDSQSMRQTLVRLHSIILVPEGDNDIIRTLHPSFFDFITSRDRCSISQLLVDPTQQHTVLVAACLRTMQGLKHNICELPDPSILNSEVADLSSRIAEFIPAEMQYACRHWGTHIQYAVISEDIWVILHQFCSKYMLFWVEACSLLGDLRNQLDRLDDVQRTLTKHVHQGSAAAATMALLHDCERLMQEFFPAVSTASAHVYDSALTFAPQDSALRKYYSPQIKVTGGPKEWNACSRIIEGHTKRVMHVAYSLDGTRIASGSTDRTIRLWDAISGAHLNTLEGHSNNINSVAFSPDGTTIASGSDDKTTRLWDAVSGKHLVTLEGHSDVVRSVAYCPDGTRIASGSNDHTIQLWDAASGAHLNTLKGHSDSVLSITFSPDGTTIASSSGYWDKTLRLWDAVSGKHLVALKGHSDSVGSVAYSPNGTRLVSGSDDHTIRIWDAIKRKHRKTLKGHKGSVHSVSFSPDGTTIASSGDKTIRLWDAISGDNLVTLEGHSKIVYSVSFSPAGTHIVSGSLDDTIRLWVTGHRIPPESRFPRTFSRFKITSSLVNHDRISDTNIRRVSFSLDASVIIYAPASGPPMLCDAVTRAYPIALKGHSCDSPLALSHDGTRIVAGFGKRVRVWDTVSGRILKILEGHQIGVQAVAFSPDGTRIASATINGTTRLWDAVTGAHIHIWERQNNWQVDSVAFSPAGTRIASVFTGHEICLWDTLHGTLLATFKTANNPLNSIAFSPDGNHVVGKSMNSEKHNYQLELWDPSFGAEALQVIKTHGDSPALWFPFFPDHRDLATDDDLTRQWAHTYAPNTRYNYFMQDGWLWFAHPRRRLCWVPLTYRGRVMFASNNARIAITTPNTGLVLIIDFSEILDR